MLLQEQADNHLILLWLERGHTRTTPIMQPAAGQRRVHGLRPERRVQKRKVYPKSDSEWVVAIKPDPLIR